MAEDSALGHSVVKGPGTRRVNTEETEEEWPGR